MATSSPPPPDEVLAYTIAASTPHSGKYGPENILVDSPKDQSSRWSGAFQGNVHQWILLRLKSPAVVKSITFGKFSKQHPCNLKELKVLVGMSEDNMTEALHAGLKNDSQPETFRLRHTNNAGVAFPSVFVKIVPILAYAPNFHVSIWHVSLKGIADAAHIEGIKRGYEEYREAAVLRHVLKHLRQRRLLTPYQTILSRANIQLEHPLVTSLHDSLVLQGNWSKCEQLFGRMGAAGLFDSHLHSLQPYANWLRLRGTDPDGDGDIPPARGGHAMCMDPINDMIYLFGGWDGEKDLDDFWVYSVKEDKWTLISEATHKEQNAPGPRSCHKMVFDTKTGSIYLLGRLSETDSAEAPTPPPGDSVGDSQTRTLCSEFYRYHTRGVDTGKWDFLSFDTGSQGGPPLIYDHQMAVDSEAQILYVFGGCVVDGDSDTHRYSGLYSYNIRLSKWRQLQSSVLDNGNGIHAGLSPRSGHSMVLDASTKTLYIFAGQIGDKYLSDMYAYDINSGIATELFSNFSVAGGPEPCFTQRAVIDTNAKEIYILCGLTKGVGMGRHNTHRAYLTNWVYKYDTKPGTWMQILRENDRPISELPLPRYAHQAVYNPNTRAVYLHGGNSGGLNYENLSSRMATTGTGETGALSTPVSTEHEEEGEPQRVTLTTRREPDAVGKEKRLDDFWRMELRRPGREEIIRQAKFKLRCQQFREMCEESPPFTALSFLKKDVSEVVDHKNPKESELFRALMKHLLSNPDAGLTKSAIGTPITPRSPARGSTSLSSSPSMSPSREDARELSSRPRKRPKPERQESGVWTNEFEEEMPAFPVIPTHDGVQHLRDVVDPLEAVIRGKSPGVGGGSDGGDVVPHLSGERYGQRTEVFESLLKFVMDGEKQPSESLLDLVDGARGGGMF
ncbi:hypothetical protein CVT24_007035 [Panaeolus cyanescens]|uniref:Muskelin N-terminal domain-containing protein n=1 Tax=Panaeolus cyanescens TaxID=181874 RepID=A0A409YKI2_9AGAR|nr:hypothetical protein CVT24_007035 [Panaeolus cyanescens]